jgi:hypothetical protein
MILNLTSPQQKTIGLQMPVSLLTVQKKTAQNEPLQKVRLNFRDYTLNEVMGKVRLSVNEEGNGKCFSCHVSGMRQLIPRKTATLLAEPVQGEVGFNQLAPADFAFRRLVELNKIIRRYGAVDWDNKIHPEDHGPTLGKTQGCTACHDGVTRGALSVFTSEAQLRQKVFTELSMSPNPFTIRELERSEMKNPELTPEEEQHLAGRYHQNRQIVNDFLDSRAEILRQWFLQTPCSDKPSTNKPTIEAVQDRAKGARPGLIQKQKENL